MSLQVRNFSSPALPKLNQPTQSSPKSQVSFGKGSSSSSSGPRDWYTPPRRPNDDLLREQLLQQLQQKAEAERKIDPKVQMQRFEQFEQGEVLLAEMDILDVKDLQKFCDKKFKAYNAEYLSMTQFSGGEYIDDTRLDAVSDQKERFGNALKQINAYIKFQEASTSDLLSQQIVEHLRQKSSSNDPKVQMERFEKLEKGELALENMDMQDVKDLKQFCDKKFKAYVSERTSIIQNKRRMDDLLYNSSFSKIGDQMERFGKVLLKIDNHMKSVALQEKLKLDKVDDVHEERLDQLQEGELLLAEMDVRDVKSLRTYCDDKYRRYDAEEKSITNNPDTLSPMDSMSFDIICEQKERYGTALKQVSMYLRYLEG